MGSRGRRAALRFGSSGGCEATAATMSSSSSSSSSRIAPAPIRASQQLHHHTCRAGVRQRPTACLLVLAGRHNLPTGINFSAVAGASSAGTYPPRHPAAAAIGGVGVGRAPVPAAAVVAVAAATWRLVAAPAVGGSCLAGGDGLFCISCCIHFGEGLEGVEDGAVAGAAAARGWRGWGAARGMVGQR